MRELEGAGGSWRELEGGLMRMEASLGAQDCLAGGIGGPDAA
jgi:hypothetical protein